MSEYYQITPGYFENLPRKVSSAGVLFFNQSKELLIVKPNYKSGWGIPGGMLDDMEAPKQGALREVKEELGLIKTDLELLCIDYIQKDNPERDSYQFIFDGGILDQSEIDQIVLEEAELDAFRFVTFAEAETLLGESIGKRVKLILNHHGSFPIYIELDDVFPLTNGSWK